MRQGGQFNHNGIPRPNITARDHHAHYAGFANQPAIGRPIQHRRHQPRSEPVDLDARIAQPGNFHNCIRPQPQPRADRQAE